MIPERCPTCGSVVSVVTADEGTSHYRPVDGSTPSHLLTLVDLVGDYGCTPRPRLLTDEMVEDAAEAIADEFGYALDSERHEEMYDAAHWKRLARRALEAALGGRPDDRYRSRPAGDHG